MSVSVALAIPTAKGRSDRQRSLERLVGRLEPLPYFVGPPLIHENISSTKEWSEFIWRWASEQPVTHGLFLHDDVMPSEGFWPALLAMIEAHPDNIIGLHAVHSHGRVLAKKGVFGYTTSDGFVGPQGVIPIPILKELLAWRRDSLIDDWDITEDTLVGCFALATGKKIWHPIPAIARHDHSIESTWGNKVLKDPSVNRGDDCWPSRDLSDPESWKGEAPHLGRLYKLTPHICARNVKRWTVIDTARAIIAGLDR